MTRHLPALSLSALALTLALALAPARAEAQWGSSSFDLRIDYSGGLAGVGGVLAVGLELTALGLQLGYAAQGRWVPVESAVFELAVGSLGVLGFAVGSALAWSNEPNDAWDVVAPIGFVLNAWILTHGALSYANRTPPPGDVHVAFAPTTGGGAVSVSGVF